MHEWARTLCGLMSTEPGRGFSPTTWPTTCGARWRSFPTSRPTAGPVVRGCACVALRPGRWPREQSRPPPTWATNGLPSRRADRPQSPTTRTPSPASSTSRTASRGGPGQPRPRRVLCPRLTVTGRPSAPLDLSPGPARCSPSTPTPTTRRSGWERCSARSSTPGPWSEDCASLMVRHRRWARPRRPCGPAGSRARRRRPGSGLAPLRATRVPPTAGSPRRGWPR
jgi:hypothetical protein